MFETYSFQLETKDDKIEVICMDNSAIDELVEALDADKDKNCFIIYSAKGNENGFINDQEFLNKILGAQLIGFYPKLIIAPGEWEKLKIENFSKLPQALLIQHFKDIVGNYKHNHERIIKFLEVIGDNLEVKIENPTFDAKKNVYRGKIGGKWEQFTIESGRPSADGDLIPIQEAYCIKILKNEIKFSAKEHNEEIDWDNFFGTTNETIVKDNVLDIINKNPDNYSEELLYYFDDVLNMNNLFASNIDKTLLDRKNSSVLNTNNDGENLTIDLEYNAIDMFTDETYTNVFTITVMGYEAH